MQSLVRFLLYIFDTFLTCASEKMIVKRDEESLLTSTNDYIVKWVDYSEKHGLGYQLSGGAVGVYMTDMTSVVLHPNEQCVTFFVVFFF